ncbi:MAG: twin-arginine translocase TatA/TatE family subunit [Bryobacteraceae bacterium]|jgi:TatA/E family protein of Tat protein translocase
MGTVGTQELVAIFLLALLLFGPKKLPELGRTVGKALTEFRRAQSELKATFDREMKNLERETGIKELTATSYQSDSYNYDYSSYDSTTYDGSYDSTVTSPTSIAGASAIEGAGSTAPLQIEAAAGSIANGHLETAPAANGHSEPGHPAASHEANLHEAAPHEAGSTEKPVNS